MAKIKSGDKRAKLQRILSSPKLYIESFLKIADKNGKVIPFKLNPQQDHFINNMSKYNVIGLLSRKRTTKT